jgi:methylmalonyl-CoA/ethylmalonyl-CoA epimerase
MRRAPWTSDACRSLTLSADGRKAYDRLFIMNTDLFVCIDHVGLAVPNLDEAIKFHTEVMGWRVLHRETNEEQGVEEAMLGTGDQGVENAQIQLLAPLNENSTIAKFIAKNGPGIQQLAYRVKDIDAVSEALRAGGVRMLYPEPKIGTGGSRIQFAHPKDTGGILLEIVEPAAH